MSVILVKVSDLTPNQSRTYAFHFNCGRTHAQALSIALKNGK